jgi:peptidyl-tRNA hydrolase
MHSQVVVLNHKLGKATAAEICARASLRAILNYIDSQEVRLWIAQGSNIVALGAASSIELRELHTRAIRKSLFTSEVYLDDKLVAIGIGPHINETLKPIVNHLKSL